jgi:hypothetical protein
MPNIHPQVLLAMLDAILGHPENYSPEQLTALEAGLQKIQRLLRKGEEEMEHMDDTDHTTDLLNAIDAA